MTNWTPKDTTTHQDHVIAHVLGATFLGYFVFEEALYLLLDIGFIWTIFLDGEMNLLPHPVAMSELAASASMVQELRADIDLLLSNSPRTEQLLRMTSMAGDDRFEIGEVSFAEQEDRRRFVLDCGDANLAIETSLTTRGITVYEFQ